MAMHRVIVLPRVVSAVWALWAWATMIAYFHETPEQLFAVARLLPGHAVPVVWGIAATLMTIGAVIPPGGTVGGIARISRSVGMTLTAGLLCGWGMAYLCDSMDQQNRLWVSAKNYFLLALVAMACGLIVGRNTGRTLESQVPDLPEVPGSDDSREG
ncbi:hypothetical protein KRX51_03280 [Corynebacterium sp. TAE3-ERU12]|uniref:hypothetical protein n=1 Tax=Corynebacterium sp. TAE3-ERU12 TaxID=2849491 RepID=UPI001C43FD5E|nr:hypothetical protein [Corynebacterium sp. TAE3-ERU12]MBV7294941.1 hypothetical protein [Corynebacterium sp. TAE3-ERU12]